MSGQLLSIVNNIEQQAQRRVEAQKDKLRASGKNAPSALQFCGVLHAKVVKIRSLSQPKCDVIYDPKKPDDDAHANLVVRDKGLEEILTVTDALLECLIWVPKDQIGTDQALSSA
jgi:hypothetical protein